MIRSSKFARDVDQLNIPKSADGVGKLFTVEGSVRKRIGNSTSLIVVEYLGGDDLVALFLAAS